MGLWHFALFRKVRDHTLIIPESVSRNADISRFWRIPWADWVFRFFTENCGRLVVVHHDVRQLVLLRFVVGGCHSHVGIVWSLLQVYKVLRWVVTRTRTYSSDFASWFWLHWFVEIPEFYWSSSHFYFFELCGLALIVSYSHRFIWLRLICLVFVNFKFMLINLGHFKILFNEFVSNGLVGNTLEVTYSGTLPHV